ncbi:fumarylacetoacetate hydrolase family protein [Vibrio sp. S4M6]|uniref:fumarylacetoacetate hydrolase family protein n=1 Tax=Vibrio sinus TaxID=2946865 RepID=UPI00202AB7F3|nr:fumarylacetoacetate hydrolase family protein [Vibrio sinus]MCL9782429.1 fumarylacetoacetate hydrolase family protein [Vibrio sinus]
MKYCWLVVLLASLSFSSQAAKKYVRYQFQGEESYGQVTGNQIQPLIGDIFSSAKPIGNPISLSEVGLLLPVKSNKVFAVGMNFASHLPSNSSAPPPIFSKLVSSLVLSGDTVKLPSDAKNVHFEGELVLVIGKSLHKATQAQAEEAIFGVLVGNDITERNWQRSDLQWLRAKSSNGFGPISPEIVTGLDINDLVITTRLNGEVVQKESTKNMIHKPTKVVSYLSQYFTLMPGDLIFMGTPGRTQPIKKGDEVQVSIENVGNVINLFE